MPWAAASILLNRSMLCGEVWGLRWWSRCGMEQVGAEVVEVQVKSGAGDGGGDGGGGDDQYR
jgi:hypothetical protein